MTKRVIDRYIDINTESLPSKLTEVAEWLKAQAVEYGEDSELSFEYWPTGYEIQIASYRDETPTEEKRRLKVEAEQKAHEKKRLADQLIREKERAESLEKEELARYEILKKKYG